MADPKTWGPILWKILHSTCENLGNNVNVLLQNDEMNYFKQLQKKLYFILPCKICKEHYKSYSKNIKDVPYNKLKIYAKEYFYNLHKNINNSNFNFNDLEITYKYDKEIMNKNIYELSLLYHKFSDLRYIQFKEFNDFIAILNMLRRFM